MAAWLLWLLLAGYSLQMEHAGGFTHNSDIGPAIQLSSHSDTADNYRGHIIVDIPQEFLDNQPEVSLSRASSQTSIHAPTVSASTTGEVKHITIRPDDECGICLEPLLEIIEAHKAELKAKKLEEAKEPETNNLELEAKKPEVEEPGADAKMSDAQILEAKNPEAEEQETIITTLQVCRHSFCTKCINEWFLKQSSCPVCREIDPHASASRPPESVAPGSAVQIRPLPQTLAAELTRGNCCEMAAILIISWTAIVLGILELNHFY